MDAGFRTLISIAVTAVLASMVTSGLALISLVVALALNRGLAPLDNRRIRASGVEISDALAVFLVPAYLFIRQGKLNHELCHRHHLVRAFPHPQLALLIIANTVRQGIPVTFGR